jgi:8-oxo-dGTP pyrophosphatase MutT (NUDIX family)
VPGRKFLYRTGLLDYKAGAFFKEAQLMAVVPKDAATVMLIRDTDGREGEGIEVLVMRRHPKSDFVPGSYVFPGGALEDEDCREEAECRCTGLDRTRAAAVLGDAAVPEHALGIWVAAIRETFEEAGILLACREDGQFVSVESDSDRERFTSHRRRLARKEITFADMLEREKLTLATERLHYYSHWITPEPLPIRYDTRFFVCEAPPHQTAFHDGVELTAHHWTAPQRALEDYDRGMIRMVIPTVVTLEELSRFSRAADAIASTKGKVIPANLVQITIDEANNITAHTPDGRKFAIGNRAAR